MSSVAKRFMDLFAGFAGAHGTHGVPDRDPEGLKWNIKKTAKTLRQSVTTQLWQDHLEGKRPLGVIPIREDSSCSWGSIDFDVYDTDILKIVADVERTKLPLVPCRSKSGGLHLFLFLREPCPASEVLASLKDAAASLGMADSEIFPKQGQILAERADTGNWMVMPYFGGDFGGKLKMQRGLKKTGAEMTPEEFLRFAEKSKTTLDEFVKLCVVRRLPPAASKGKRGSGGKPGKGDFSDGPPCLQHLTASGVQKDGRKRTLFMMALYFKRCDQATWKEKLEEANRKFFTPSLPSEEVMGVIRSCEKKDYEYTCKEEPMKSHCNSSLCRMRKFGVGRGGEYPIITGMRKLLTEPPRWFVDVENACLELSTEELQTYIRFHRACMDRVGKCYMMVRQDAWLSIVAEAMSNMTTIDAPPDASVSGQFHELLEEFLTNRARGTRPEDLLLGRPYENPDEKRHYFTLRALGRFLHQEGMRDMTRGQITSRLTDMGGKHRFLNFENKKGLNTWSVPTDKIQGAGEVRAPEPPGEEI